MNIQIRSFLDCTYQQSLQAWNGSWKGYFFDMTLDMERFLYRFNLEHLVAEASFIAFDGERPVGFVMNGIQTIAGKKVAWVGGIAVAPDYRKYGLGEKLMQSSFNYYQAVQVEIARLEAIIANEKAINLYKKLGYEVIDQLAHFVYSIGDEQTLDLQHEMDNQITKQFVYPSELTQLDFYKSELPWQTQWQNVRNGEGLVIYNHAEEPIGYALFNVVDQPNGDRMLNIYQCEVAPDTTLAPTEIVLATLSTIFNRAKPTKRIMAVNLSQQNKPLIDELQRLGFTTYVEQVHMEKKLI